MTITPLFGEPDNSDEPELMSPSQRIQIRRLFSKMGAESAKEQFQFVREIVGVDLKSVKDFDATSAQVLIHALKAKIQSASSPATGDAWADRDAPTWIDRL